MQAGTPREFARAAFDLPGHCGAPQRPSGAEQSLCAGTGWRGLGFGPEDDSRIETQGTR